MCLSQTLMQIQFTVFILTTILIFWWTRFFATEIVCHFKCWPVLIQTDIQCHINLTLCLTQSSSKHNNKLSILSILSMQITTQLYSQKHDSQLCSFINGRPYLYPKLGADKTVSAPILYADNIIHSLIITREGLILTLSIRVILWGWIWCPSLLAE